MPQASPSGLARQAVLLLLPPEPSTLSRLGNRPGLRRPSSWRLLVVERLLQQQLGPKQPSCCCAAGQDMRRHGSGGTGSGIGAGTGARVVGPTYTAPRQRRLASSGDGSSVDGSSVRSSAEREGCCGRVRSIHSSSSDGDGEVRSDAGGEDSASAAGGSECRSVSVAAAAAVAAHLDRYSPRQCCSQDGGALNGGGGGRGGARRRTRGASAARGERAGACARSRRVATRHARTTQQGGERVVSAWTSVGAARLEERRSDGTVGRTDVVLSYPRSTTAACVLRARWARAALGQVAACDGRARAALASRLPAERVAPSEPQDGGYL